MNLRIEDYNKILPINEIYPACQAEGSRTGTPTIIVRTTGCTLRGFCREGGWCDAWKNSIEPEKGVFTFNDIIRMYDENPHIKEMMLTGGSPTMHPALVNELTHFAKERNILITMETEGSRFVDTDFPIGLVSLSPKFTNSIPVLNHPTPGRKLTTQSMIDLHEKNRKNYDVMKSLITNSLDYQYKPVWDGKEETLQEIEYLRKYLNIPKEKTYVMPAGDNREQLIKMYPIVMEMCVKEGYRFTGRPHIIGYDTRRFV